MFDRTSLLLGSFASYGFSLKQRGFNSYSGVSFTFAGYSAPQPPPASAPEEPEPLSLWSEPTPFPWVEDDDAPEIFEGEEAWRADHLDGDTDDGVDADEFLEVAAVPAGDDPCAKELDWHWSHGHLPEDPEPMTADEWRIYEEDEERDSKLQWELALRRAAEATLRPIVLPDEPKRDRRREAIMAHAAARARQEHDHGYSR